jgi:hypothetical protein
MLDAIMVFPKKFGWAFKGCPGLIHLRQKLELHLACALRYAKPFDYTTPGPAWAAHPEKAMAWAGQVNQAT